MIGRVNSILKDFGYTFRVEIENDNNLRRSAEASARRAQDFDDLQNEAAGRDTGRISRFFPDSTGDRQSSEKRRENESRHLTQLQMMLNDPEYLALYDETTEVLRDTQRRLDQAMTRAQDMRNAVADEIEQMETDAARTADGRRAFRDSEADWRYADGSKVEDEMAATIILRGNEPSYEDYSTALDRREGLDGIITDITAGQAEVGEMQEETDDHDDPLLSDEMRDYQAGARSIADGIDRRLDQITPTQAPEAQPSVSSPVSNLAFPEI